MVNTTVKAYIQLLMEMFMRANLKTVYLMVKENAHMLMVVFMRANG